MTSNGKSMLGGDGELTNLHWEGYKGWLKYTLHS